jgi:sortase A
MLVLLGALALADAATTLLWREPVTALIATLREGGLESQLRRVDRLRPSRGEREALLRIRAERRRVRFLAQRLERDAAYGSAVGRIVIPRIHASYVVVKGAGEPELELGPGIYSKALFPGTSFPGAGPITAIAGHRTTWLQPFRHIDELRPGDRIFVTMPYGRFTYLVTRERIVPEADVSAVLTPSRLPDVVLSACYPLFSAEKRILVFARLAEIKPRGAALIHAPSQPAGVFGATLSAPSQLIEGSPTRGEAGGTITSGARSPASAPRLPRS